MFKKPKTIENLQKIEKAQQHVADHNDVYLAAAGGLLVGALLTRIVFRTNPAPVVHVVIAK